MIDWDNLVLAPHEGVFGELVTYLPAAGASFSTSAIFDSAYREVDLAGGIGVTTEMPVAGVRLSQFFTPPLQGDQVIIRGATYKVKEVRPDSHGFAKLMLNRVSP